MRRFAEEFMEETKQPIGNEINVKQLARRYSPPMQQQDDAEDQRIKEEFYRYGGPARHAINIVQGEPRRLTWATQATAIQKATNATEHDANGDNDGKPIASRALILKKAFSKTLAVLAG